jgi:hypothetical protein
VNMNEDEIFKDDWFDENIRNQIEIVEEMFE